MSHLAVALGFATIDPSVICNYMGGQLSGGQLSGGGGGGGGSIVGGSIVGGSIVALPL